MFLAGMKVHEKSDRSDIPCSSEGIDQIVFFLPPAAFYAWAAHSLMTCEPSAARLLHRLGAVPLKQHFQTGHIRTRSHRRPQLLHGSIFSMVGASSNPGAIQLAQHPQFECLLVGLIDARLGE